MLAGWSAAWGYAEWQLAAPNRLVTQWQKRGWADDMAPWGWIYAAYRRAIEVNPANADYPAQMGGIRMWRAHQARLFPGAMRAEAAEAVIWYRRALRLRPASGALWAHLAGARYIAQGFDDGVSAAIERAAALAPWDVTVQRRLSGIGIPNWSQTPESDRSRILAVVRNAMRLPESANAVDEYVIDLAIEYNWLGQLEPLLVNDRQRAVLARKLEHRNRPRT